MFLSRAALAAIVHFAATAMLPLDAAAAPGGRSIVLVLDNSGSMRANDPGSTVKQQLGDLIRRFADDDRVGVVVFDQGATVMRRVVPLGGADGRDELQRIVAGMQYSGGLTDIPAAIERAQYELGANAEDRGLRAVILVTDGIVDTGSPAKDAEQLRWLREELLPDCKARGVRIFGVAFTEHADYRLLQSMAFTTDGAYFRILTPEEAPEAFKQMEAALEAVAPPAAAAPPPTPAPAERIIVLPSSEDDRARRWFIGIAVGALLLSSAALIAVLFKRPGAPAPAPAGESIPEARLVDRAGKSIALTKPVMRIGRGSDNDIALSDHTISKTHARIECRDGVFWLVDLRSLNGTAVNGKALTGETVLRHGDVIRFNALEHRFLLATAAAEDADGPGMGTVMDVPREKSAATASACKRHPSVLAVESCPRCGTPSCEVCARNEGGVRGCATCVQAPRVAGSA